MTLFRECFRHLGEIERRRIPPIPREHMRLHRLERPEPWPSEVVEAMRAGPPDNWYPDYAAFYRRLSAFVGVPEENLVVGAGIEDFIRTLILLCCEPADGFAFTWPTCAMFDIYSEVFLARPVRIVTDPKRLLSVHDVCDKIDSGVKLLVLPNPGQPVETYFCLAELRHIAQRCADVGAVFAIDEAYLGFGADTALPLVDDFENVVILRTFSKAFGGAGLRVGYAIGQPSVIRPLNAIRESGEIAGPSLHAATVLMDMWQSYIEPGIQDVCRGRDWLRDTLLAADFDARGWFSNHVLIGLGDRASHVAARLHERGVHVKANFPAPLDKHLLVTCGSELLMQRFYEAFRASL